MAYFNSPSNVFSSDMEVDWSNTDTSQFLWDSPQPEAQNLPTGANEFLQGSGTDFSSQNMAASGTQEHPWASNDQAKAEASGGNSFSNQNAPYMNFSMPSSTSETSSHSSSSGSSGQKKRKASHNTSPPAPLATDWTDDDDVPSNILKMDRMFEGGNDNFPFEDTNYPAMGQGLDNLSLNAMGTPSVERNFDFGPDTSSPGPAAASIFTGDAHGYSPQSFTPLRSTQSANASPQMTIQPSKTFFIGGSREESPNSIGLVNSQESSPAAIFATNSPLQRGADGLATTFSNNGMMSGLQQFNASPMTFGLDAPNVSNGLSPTLSLKSGPGSSLPCQLEIDPTPEKSRVETQIPIKMTLRNAPPGVHRVHLPSHTISKPKFQSKPQWERCEDTLEVSAMLVCASAMEKPGVEELAFQRAAANDIFVQSEENQPASSKGQSDDNDPSKPLNGGPVAICSGCIVRERKRAARKKTKKAEEEEEWAKDEAKRVIVFNCPEVRDWYVPGNKETMVKNHDGPVDTMYVTAPMRIACYCRHQNEKVGFQVIFTLRTADDTILAQAITQSIMITDDHKQPSTGSTTSMTFSNSGQPGGDDMFQPGQNFGMQNAPYPQPMPFRNSFSTNDLRQLGNQYAPQRHPTNLSRHTSGFSQTPSTTTSTATATPRNLSRPASPTEQPGPTAKKRRSGHNKVPSGLTMTRMGNTSTSAANMGSAGPMSGGPMSAGFAFGSPSTTAFGPSLDYPMPSASTSNPFQSGPPTPLHGPGVSGSGLGTSVDPDIYQFYSAPTSQHPSRAPSPSSATRAAPTSFPSSMHVLEQTSDALSRLPPGFNLNRPPIIQRVIPHLGPRTGGDEVTVLGTGFFQGLEVMFGDQLAINTTYWGDTTLVCRAPAAQKSGDVPVIFKHQHRSSELQSIRGILPTQLVLYSYFDDDRQQMSGLTMSIGPDQQAPDLGQIGAGDLAQGFLHNPAGFAGLHGPGGRASGNQQRPGSAYDMSKLGEPEFENSLMRWLDLVDLRDSPYRPRFDKKNERGQTLMSLAAGRGFTRFVAGLLARGANPDSRDRCGYTPLMMASLRGHTGTVRRLLIRGADSTLRTLQGFTAADLASDNQVTDALSDQDYEAVRKVESHDRDLFRRPSSAPSLDSLSGLSTSSQPFTYGLLDEDKNKFGSTTDGTGLTLQSPWALRKKTARDFYSDCSHAYPAFFHATAALAAWREQMVAQLHHFQQQVWSMQSLQLPSLPPMPSLQFPSLPQTIHKLDYQQYYDQYPVVRRISDFLSPTLTPPESSSNSVRPPRYEDIFPSSGAGSNQKRRPSDVAALARNCGVLQNEDNATTGLPCSACESPPSAAGGGGVAMKRTESAPLPSRVMLGSGPARKRYSTELGSAITWALLLMVVTLGVSNYTRYTDACRPQGALGYFKEALNGAGTLMGAA